jgi:hypothetical protein
MKTKTFAAIAAALLATGASAATGSFTGTFAQDNSIFKRSFRVDAPSLVTLTGLGYAGGVNAAGATIVQGGFDTVLSVYDASGALVIDNDDGFGVPADSVTGAGGDSLISQVFAAGTYTAYLTQYNNFGPLQLPGSFAFAGEPNFRGGFVDLYGDQRTNAFAFDITGASAVPEAATWMLMIAGFGMVGVVARRRNAAVVA